MNHPETLIKVLENGLVLRRSTFEDREELAEFNGLIHADPGEEFSQQAANDARMLLSGKHPTFHAGDFTIVEDPHSGKIVSSMCLIDQTWAYEGIEFGVGRPELVGTHQDYRRRGLVRQQFEVVHQWSAQRGQKLQAITGIPWYYRQFGYEMGLNLGGSRRGYLSDIPTLETDQEEPFRFRDLIEDEIPFLTKLYRQASQRQLVACVRDENIWRYELTSRDLREDPHYHLQIIETEHGKAAGYLLTRPGIFGGNLVVSGFEMAEGENWFTAAHSLLRHLERLGNTYTQQFSSSEKPLEMQGFVFSLGEDHPIYQVIPNRIPQTSDPYAYYIRVPDLPDFLTTIRPVLEERLARSYLARYSGELYLNFYTGGLIMTFESGRLKEVAQWDSPAFETSSANFPDLTFLQLVFGYRNVQQLEDGFADLYYRKEEAKPLFAILFPRKASHVMDLS